MLVAVVDAPVKRREVDGSEAQPRETFGFEGVGVDDEVEVVVDVELTVVLMVVCEGGDVKLLVVVVVLVRGEDAARLDSEDVEPALVEADDERAVVLGEDVRGMTLVVNPLGVVDDMAMLVVDMVKDDPVEGT